MPSADARRPCPALSSRKFASIWRTWCVRSRCSWGFQHFEHVDGLGVDLLGLGPGRQPNAPLRLNEVLRLIAQLGGILASKSDGEPGVKTIWQGLQRVMDVATALQSMREGYG